jgi:LuxR family transcriptional regulator, maltose regulon positive regulatory protein
VDAYTGEFLPDDVYDDWTHGSRDEARSRFVLAAHRAARRALETGDVDRAVALALRLLAVDRYDEGAHRLRVRALVDAGTTSEAQRAHDAWAAAMSELDVAVPPLDALRRAPRT